MEVNDNEMIEALSRSGYLLETEITNLLIKLGYEVENSISIKDQFTGKTREIDLITRRKRDSCTEPIINKCFTQVNYAFEIKNNLAPLVLMTKVSDSDQLHDWNGIKEHISCPKEMQCICESYYDKIIFNQKYSSYSQYCSFQQKKDKGNTLIAFHPENIYSGISKLIQYCDEKQFSLGGRYKVDNEYYRNLLFIPVILISDSLIELDMEDFMEPKLKSVEASKLLCHYHNEESSKMSYVHIVTKKGLPSFLKIMEEAEKEITFQMEKTKKRNSKYFHS